jgi:hypothetical protein
MQSGGAEAPISQPQVMLDKIDSGSKLQTQLPVFISWRSSGREAGERQPLEAGWAERGVEREWDGRRGRGMGGSGIWGLFRRRLAGG